MQDENESTEVRMKQISENSEKLKITVRLEVTFNNLWSATLHLLMVIFGGNHFWESQLWLPLLIDST